MLCFVIFLIPIAEMADRGIVDLTQDPGAAHRFAGGLKVWQGQFIPHAQQLFADKALSAQLRRARTVLISDRNLQLLGTSYSFDDYARFYEEKFAPLHIKPELYLDAEGQEIRQIYEDELPEDYQPEPDEEEPVDDGGEWYEE